MVLRHLPRAGGIGRLPLCDGHPYPRIPRNIMSQGPMGTTVLKVTSRLDILNICCLLQPRQLRAFSFKRALLSAGPKPCASQTQHCPGLPIPSAEGSPGPPSITLHSPGGTHSCCQASEQPPVSWGLESHMDTAQVLVCPEHKIMRASLTECLLSVILGAKP